MIRINQLKIAVDQSQDVLEEKIIKTLKLKPEQLKSWQIAKKSIDARKKPELFYVFSVDVEVENEAAVLNRVHNNNVQVTKAKNYQLPENGTVELKHRPVIIGAGPAGLFAAYLLAKEGYAPIVLERGKSVEERQADVNHFWKTGILNPKSNVQFGEGGAGTFSDGKLNTLVKDPSGRNQLVLETFVNYGAPEQILYEGKPHIGTDVLAVVIKNMRNDIIKMGGTFCFDSCMTGFETANDGIKSVVINEGNKIETDVCILSLGHSARDTFRMLDASSLSMEPKSFAVGFRVEHPQEEVNRKQYGDTYYDKLPAAPYKVTANLSNGRGVYSFCMCPGGYVVNASSEPERLAVNGMSYSKRDGKNANSAIIVSVTKDDFEGTDALAGVRFQEKLEEKAFLAAGGKIPQQLFGDFCNQIPSTAYGSYESETCGEHALGNLRGIFPKEVEESFIEGMHVFSNTIHGFDRADAILSGVESRTSSPVRISRDDNFEANIKGIYPCGEGAGYAGGIMSAAMDGIKVAEAIIRKYSAESIEKE